MEAPHSQENTDPLGPYRRHMLRVLGGSQGDGRFLMGEVPLCGRMYEPTRHLRGETLPSNTGENLIELD
jgi:hypothetical protein